MLPAATLVQFARNGSKKSVCFADTARNRPGSMVVAHPKGMVAAAAIGLFGHDDPRAVLAQRFEIKTDGKIARSECFVHGAQKQRIVVRSIKKSTAILQATATFGHTLAKRNGIRVTGIIHDIATVVE